jgi:ribosomal protein L40E
LEFFNIFTTGVLHRELYSQRCKALFFKESVLVNIKKARGLLLCLTGVLLAKSDRFFDVSGPTRLVVTAAGILLAFCGLAVFASGMHPRSEKIRVCRHCFYQNPVAAASCGKCKKPLHEKTPEGPAA